MVRGSIGEMRQMRRIVTSVFPGLLGGGRLTGRALAGALRRAGCQPSRLVDGIIFAEDMGWVTYDNAARLWSEPGASSNCVAGFGRSTPPTGKKARPTWLKTTRPTRSLAPAEPGVSR